MQDAGDPKRLKGLTDPTQAVVFGLVLAAVCFGWALGIDDRRNHAVDAMAIVQIYESMPLGSDIEAVARVVETHDRRRMMRISRHGDTVFVESPGKFGAGNWVVSFTEVNQVVKHARVFTADSYTIVERAEPGFERRRQ